MEFQDHSSNGWTYVRTQGQAENSMHPNLFKVGSIKSSIQEKQNNEVLPRLEHITP